MTKIFLLTTFFLFGLHALEIPTAHVKSRTFMQNVELNAQIIQLPNAKQSIMSQVSGHIEKYFVKEGQRVKEGQKIVLIESIMISKMTAEFLSLKRQLESQQKNYDATNALYKKGMTSLQELNTQSIKKDALFAKMSALKSQLDTLSIDTQKLQKASGDFILYAHSDGIVSRILQPAHSSISANSQIISLVKEKAYYLKAYLPLEYATRAEVGQKIVMHINDEDIISHVTQILPKVDETTQRIILLASIDERAQNLFINAYTSATLYFGEGKEYPSVEKTALSFFNNEWVVFVPKEEEHHEDEGEAHHEEHEEHESPYEVRVVEIITSDESFVAIRGLRVGEEYVSGNSYFVKSMMLKSSLGGHGH